MREAERDIMARLRGLGSRAAPEDIARQRDALPASEPDAPLDLASAFRQRLEASGATSCAVADRIGAVRAIAEAVAARQSQRRFVTGLDPRLAALPWRESGLLPRFGTAGADDRISVSYARCGIAETGTVCLWVDRDNPALNNLLCEHHIVLVDRSSLRPYLGDIWQERALQSVESRPRGVMLVSGPSSTADIAMELVMGAHGPRSLHVIVLGTEAA